jgi:tRNA modification GTPase
MPRSWTARELTAAGRGAIRVLELSGPGAGEALRALCRSPLLAPGEFAPVMLRDARGELLDEAIVLFASPTRVELHLHGGPALVRRVLAEVGGAGAPSPASLEARAEARLAMAASDSAARMLLDQAEGALRRELEALCALADDALEARARLLAERGRSALHLVTPPRVVLAGPVNAGKSTLFNTLVGRERVVVDEAPGTTRDPVHERVQLGAYAVELHDTAGERELVPGREESDVERQGQALARELCRAADLVLWLVPPWGVAPPPAPRTCLLASRADEAEHRPAWPALSASRAPGEARAVVVAALHTALALPREPWTSGAAVPFEPEWTETLARAPAPSLREALAAWLGAHD